MRVSRIEEADELFLDTAWLPLFDYTFKNNPVLIVKQLHFGKF